MSVPKIQDRVSEEHWREAQAWEEAAWVNTQRMRARWGKNLIWKVLSWLRLVPKYRGEDWNAWWRAKFDDYRFLPASVDNAIEVGCGPYTNIRQIMERCRPRRLVLSDPLIRTYIHFKLAFVADYYRNAFATLDDHPIEELPFKDGFFDLVVMINVLDHVRDARLCMDRVVAATKPGGWLIIGQDLTSEEDLKVLKDDPGLVGHPIKLKAEWFDPWLDVGFEPAIRRVLPREQGREPRNHYATLIFAGRKTGGPV
jgi:SAM-dependent methyltransferase